MAETQTTEIPRLKSRYREEMERHGPGREALTRTLRTAGRTVVFSSLTVAAAMLSLLVFPQRFLYSMAISGSLTALAELEAWAHRWMQSPG